MKVLLPAAAAVLVAGAVAAGCDSSSGDPAEPATLPRVSVPGPVPASAGVWSLGSPLFVSRSPAAAAPGSTPSDGWEVTVYYTAIQELHHGAARAVTGCPDLNCSHGHDDLGSYPADFVQAVHDEGTGRTSDGRYLNWSYDTGYWLDTAPRDTDGQPLDPYVSSAADPGVLKHGTRFVIAGCGRQDDGSAVPPPVCATLRAGNWRIDDEFTPGLGGRKHIDAYIGPETGPDFTDSDAYVTLVGATLAID
jgi:hypothetical protein